MTQNNNYRQQQINCIKTQFIQTVSKHINHPKNKGYA